MFGSSDCGMEIGEEEIELSLGLGIGGKSRDMKAEKLATTAKVVVGEVDEEIDVVRRREVQAMRRQEARRKREEKLQIRRGGGNGGVGVNKVVKRSEGVENGGDERPAKRVKSEVKPKSKTPPLAAAVKSSEGGDQLSSAACIYPIYAYQYLPYANGFALPCIAPVFDAAAATKTKSRSSGGVAQTVSFRPFQAAKRCDEGEVKVVSNGSAAISENRSISSQDGNSSDNGSHGSQSRSGRSELHSSSGSDVSRSSKTEAPSISSTTNNAQQTSNEQPTTAPEPIQAKASEQRVPEVESKSATAIPVSRKVILSQPKTPTTKDYKVDRISPGKPPRPQPVQKQETIPQLPQMPCVSTTGNGPDGKTITGFLYRYNTTTEVRIVCVCHGESFSPAEFVRHAGGVDVTNPLRHITVVPSAF